MRNRDICSILRKYDLFILRKYFKEIGILPVFYEIMRILKKLSLVLSGHSSTERFCKLFAIRHSKWLKLGIILSNNSSIGVDGHSPVCCLWLDCKSINSNGSLEAVVRLGRIMEVLCASTPKSIPSLSPRMVALQWRRGLYFKWEKGKIPSGHSSTRSSVSLENVFLSIDSILAFWS